MSFAVIPYGSTILKFFGVISFLVLFACGGMILISISSLLLRKLARGISIVL